MVLVEVTPKNLKRRDGGRGGRGGGGGGGSVHNFFMEDGARALGFGAWGFGQVWGLVAYRFQDIGNWGAQRPVSSEFREIWDRGFGFTVGYPKDRGYLGNSGNMQLAPLRTTLNPKSPKVRTLNPKP